MKIKGENKKLIKEITEKMIKGSIIKSESGINLYTPDGEGHYHALWTRDFAYMVEGAKEFIPQEDIKNCIQYLIDYARPDGWIPDRVGKDSSYVAYTAGDENFPASENLDNGPFLAILADMYLSDLSDIEAKKCFEQWEDKLHKGIECLPVNDDGMMYNTSNPPHSPFGFTDCIKKTGALSMETLLLWRAVKVMAKWEKLYGNKGEIYIKKQRKIEEKFMEYFATDSAMLISATEKCRQIDIWATCYMISIGFPVSIEQKEKIAKWLVEHYDEIVYHGQIKHLPKDEYWEETFIPVEKDTYQNGAFWATATGWFVDAIREYNPELAEKTLNDVIEYFKEEGVYECVYGDYRQLDLYVASATNVYAAVNK